MASNTRTLTVVMQLLQNDDVDFMLPLLTRASLTQKMEYFLDPEITTQGKDEAYYYYEDKDDFEELEQRKMKKRENLKSMSKERNDTLKELANKWRSKAKKH